MSFYFDMYTNKMSIKILLYLFVLKLNSFTILNYDLWGWWKIFPNLWGSFCLIIVLLLSLSFIWIGMWDNFKRMEISVLVNSHRSFWIFTPQNERQLKRERRKQANRESARKSRLKKQAEVDELMRRYESLNVENTALKFELDQLKEDSEKMRIENAALMVIS